MSIHEPGNESERPERAGDDDTQRLDPVPSLEAQAADGGTRVLPAGAQPEGVDSLWDLDAPGAAPSGTTAEPAFTEPTSEPTRSRRRAVRVGTVVWGLVVAACGVLILAAAGGANIDGGTVVIAILGGAGVALVLGSIVTGVRRRDRA